MIPSTTQVLSFFNIVVGLMLTTSVLLFIGGFAGYLTRLGTWPTYRTEMVEVMKWGVGVLFVLVVLLGVQQYLVSHIAAAVFLAALFIIGVVVWVVLQELTKKPPAPPPNGRRGGGDE